MKKLFLLTFLVGQITFCNAQEMYVRVPDKFEFLDDENQYRLNELTAFLFEKYGYNVLYKENVPQDVDPCQILTADIDNNSGIFTSKVRLILQDCTQKTVFTSEQGKSREKDFKRSYHEALREAFKSLENFTPDTSGFSQSNIASEGKFDSQETRYEEKRQEERITPPEVVEETPEGKIYRNGDQLYELRKNSAGYILFREGDSEKFATLLKSGSGTNYIYTSENLQGNAFFESSGDLIVEYVDKNSGQLISVKYQLQD